jgi:hypothetical protein
MAPHTRSMIAAVAFACRTGKKAAGLYDHASAQDRRIAAEVRANQVQGFDGDRGVRFGGTLPEIFDAGEKAFVSFEIEEDAIKGYDRSTSTFFTAEVSGGVVQVYDHGESTWFAYDIQDADAPRSYHRSNASPG